jgi:hypothetical protein
MEKSKGKKVIFTGKGDQASKGLTNKLFDSYSLFFLYFPNQRDFYSIHN